MSFNVAIADPVIVRELTAQLIKTFENYINHFDGSVDYIDGVMAVVSLARAVVENLESQTEDEVVWRNAMLASLEFSLYGKKGKPGKLCKWALLLKQENLIDIHSLHESKQLCQERFELDFGYSWAEGENAGWRAIEVEIAPRGKRNNAR